MAKEQSGTLRGMGNGTGVIQNIDELVDVTGLAEQHLIKAHSLASAAMSETQKVLNRMRRIRQAVASGEYHAEIPCFPCREIGANSTGGEYHEPRELYDDLEEFTLEDAKGQLWRMELRPVFERLEDDSR